MTTWCDRLRSIHLPPSPAAAAGGGGGAGSAVGRRTELYRYTCSVSAAQVGLSLITSSPATHPDTTIGNRAEISPKAGVRVVGSGRRLAPSTQEMPHHRPGTSIRAGSSIGPA